MIKTALLFLRAKLADLRFGQHSEAASGYWEDFYNHKGY